MSAWRALCFEFCAMASPCSIRIETRNERAANHAARAAIAEVQRIEMKYSRYRSSSVVSRINAAAGSKSVDVDEETESLLHFAHQLHAMSDGLFDATSGVLRQAWNFKHAQIPAPADLAGYCERIGWSDTRLANGSFCLERPGMELDFGGFGKEYAADRAAGMLQKHGIAHALVNLGGDIHVLGNHALPKHAGMPWKVEIQHPRDSNARLAGIAVHEGGLATSGDYERFFELNGKRYCHVLNPRSGWPVTYWQSITVLAPNTTTAGALSTTAMLKEKEGLDWLNQQNVSYLAVRHDAKVYENLTAQ